MIVLDSVRRLLAAQQKTRPTAGAVEVPVMPERVYVIHGVAHRYLLKSITDCRIPMSGEHGAYPTADEAGTQWAAAWCSAPECFPGRRCKVCGIPSGHHDECAGCLKKSIDEDKRIERAA